ncbi:ubiquinol oxidase subunit II [Ectothiorhodospira haloalkaliphila]|uniref:Ubiquinol oxidase subunit II n=1 Tax=Ectothiorhodospira haloalkaliphila TaxID=421628 RepID=W8KTT3_9GAMM|nr:MULTISPECIES: cytochrome d ubiquinol oxidase subunit II [Ectothiorhodospira]AHK78991.1 ubiquinol oxidase subunit II [Ectothiorhodospira haloalkaliphila]MCG5493732.1 cytochrome d ubiquinol oxidase subunit II [Ectothiorhodospira variabilis]MCG5497823.1 cytochrome d ubiquinol oxidase subunit II [Ectothiorhodospira variabilis]MCG5503931.1 cytochrome d ubiquinol oxidase subunit II [Ectothiorhodospira variabilis]MCG5507086.1 cytochrome d ubiquinol oxidase subunit II [Ectothiorhodospira variabilis
MELIDLTLIWVAIIGFGVFMYVLMDGFDLGVGILYPFARNEDHRDVMMNSVAPVWDGNETWLILGGAGLLAAFPLIYAVFLPALYIGVFLLLAGLIFRGVAFEFRFKSAPGKRGPWNWSFFLGSLVASFAQGAVVGAYIQGFEVEGFSYVGGPLDWLTPFTVMTGLGLVAGYTLLGATWLIMKTEGDLQDWAYRMARWMLGAVLAVYVIVSLWTAVAHPHILERWLENATVLWVFPTLSVLAGLWLWRGLTQRNEGTPFVATLVLFVLAYAGLLISMWPYAVPPEHTFWDASSSPDAQLFTLVGILFVVPIILAYTAWTYWVFRGKVRVGEGYH